MAFVLQLSMSSYSSSQALAQEDPAAAAAPAPTKSSESMLVSTWKALGAKYAISFLIMSFLLVAVLVMLILAVRKDSFVPSDLVQGVDASLNDSNLQAAVELVRADDSFVGQVVSADSANFKPAVRRRSKRCRLSAKTKP